MLKKIVLLSVICLSVISAQPVFSGNKSVVKIVCHEVKPANIHSRISLLLMKFGIENKKVLGFVDHLFNHHAVVKASNKLGVYCNK